MATKPLTTAAIAMTEKKMDMALDDIIKMSKTGTGTNKVKKLRIPIKKYKFSNNEVQDKSMKLRRFMDTKSSLRQGALAQRRSSFQGTNHLTAKAARKAAVAPIHIRNQTMTSYRPRVQNRAATNRGFAVKQVSKQRPQTLDSLFANMKEQRMNKVVNQQQQQHHNNNHGRRTGGAGQQRPWTRYNNNNN